MSNDPCPCLSGGECRLTDEEINEQMELGQLRSRKKEFTVRSIPLIGFAWPRFSGFERFNRLRFKRFSEVTAQARARHARWGVRGEFFFEESVSQEVVLYA